MRNVLIRDNMAGVLFGQMQDKPKGKGCTLLNARKIHYWKSAAAVEGIAATGNPGKNSRITPVVMKNQVFDLVQVIDVEPEQFASLMSYPNWDPKNDQ